MAAKAYLMMLVDTTLFPPEIVGAIITSEPLVGLTATAYSERRLLVEVCHVKAGDFAQAEEKLLAMVEGTQPCQLGDLRFLWPYLDPSEEANKRRYWLDQYLKKKIELLRKEEALAWADDKVRAERKA